MWQYNSFHKYLSDHEFNVFYKFSLISSYKLSLPGKEDVGPLLCKISDTDSCEVKQKRNWYLEYLE